MDVFFDCIAWPSLLSLHFLRIVLLTWCDSRMISISAVNDKFLTFYVLTATVDHHYSLSISFVSFYYRGVMNEWYWYHLSTTTYVSCMAWTLFIDVLLFVAILDHHDSLYISSSYRTITLSLSLDHHYSLLTWCDGRMISIPAVNNHLFILHGMDFIVLMFHIVTATLDHFAWHGLYLLMFQLVTATLDHHYSITLSPSYRYVIDIRWQQQRIYFAWHRRHFMDVILLWLQPLTITTLSPFPSYRSIIVGWCTNDIDNNNFFIFAWHGLFYWCFFFDHNRWSSLFLYSAKRVQTSVQIPPVKFLHIKHSAKVKGKRRGGDSKKKKKKNRQKWAEKSQKAVESKLTRLLQRRFYLAGKGCFFRRPLSLRFFSSDLLRVFFSFFFSFSSRTPIKTKDL